MSLNTGIPTTGRIYESLAERIRGFVTADRLGTGECVGTEQDLARREGVSRMTVRRASDLLIREGLLERRPGKGLYVKASSPMTQTVQVVVANLLWQPMLEMSRGVQNVARGEGIRVQMYDAQGDADLDLATVEQLPTSGAKGAVIVSLHGPRFSEAICRLHCSGFPFVVLDQRMHDINVSSVTSDNHAGGMEVGKMLIETGHRRIAFVGDLIAASVQTRLAGLRDAIGDAGVAFDRSLVVDLLVAHDRLGDWSGCVASGTRRLMGLPAGKRPTAIFCSCDAIAIIVHEELTQMGLSVPEDVSLVGYDDDPTVVREFPQLTSVRQPFQEMGQAAMQLLNRRLQSAGNGPAEHVVLPVVLIRRESVAPPTTP